MTPFAEFAFNFLVYAMWIAAINFLLERKISLPGTLVVELLLFIPTFLLTAYLTGPLSGARILFAVVLVFLMTLLMHQGKWYIKLLTVVLVLVMMFLSEYLMAGLLPREQFNSAIQSERFDVPQVYYVLYLFCQSVLLAVLVAVGRAVRQRHTGAQISAMPLLFLLFPVSQLKLLTSWFLPTTSENRMPHPLYTTLTVLFCFASDIGLFFAMQSAARSMELRVQNRLLEEQTVSQSEAVAELQSRQEQILDMSREISVQLNGIRQLIRAGQTDEAERSVQNLHQEFGQSTGLIEGCGNTVLSSFLFHRISECRKAGIDFNCQLSIPSHLQIAASDLICAFGNLLDNAADACSEEQNKYISLSARFSPPYLSITTINPLPDTQSGKKRRIPGLERGIGTVILNDLAGKYDGEYLAGPAEGGFKASLILKEAADHASNSDM